MVQIGQEKVKRLLTKNEDQRIGKGKKRRRLKGTNLNPDPTISI